MNTQAAIEKVLQDFTRELLKVFSEAVVHAVSQVGTGGRSAIAAVAQSSTAKRAASRSPRKPAAEAKAPARAARKPGTAAMVKSSPDQVNRLSDRIIDALKKSQRNLAAREIMKQLGLRATDEGRFQYALNKLKEEGLVQQHGERRQARYGVGASNAAKPKVRRGPGRPRKNPLPEAPAAAEGGDETPAAE